MAKSLRNVLANFGVNREPLTGITMSPTLCQVAHECDRRYHAHTYQVVAVNYKGGAASAITKVTGAGVGGTATITVSPYQVPVSAAVNTGGSGYVTGDIVSIADATGAGATWTVTAAAGAITALTYVPNSAVATLIDPTLVISNVQLLVGTTAVLQTTAAMEIFRALFNNQEISYGQFPIFFTEDWRRNTDGRSTSWDMAGQSSFTSKFQLNSNYLNVNITGMMLFDYIRNTVAGEIDQATYQTLLASNQAPAPQLQIIARKLLTPTLNGGTTIIPPSQIPTGWPILRMHFFPANSQTLQQILLKADTQIIEQGNIGSDSLPLVPDQVLEFYKEWGFDTSLAGNDYSFVADYDQRKSNVLKVSNLSVQLQSAGAQQGLTILQETLQTAYA